MLYNRYMEKYRILWTGAYEWGGLPLATAHYVMRKFWEYGTVASFAYDIPGDPKLIDFTPWAMLITIAIETLQESRLRTKTMQNIFRLGF